MQRSPEFIREDIIKMAGVVEKMLEMALDPEVKKDEVRKLEKQVNQFHKSIDDATVKYMALMTPAAKDLRTAVSALKINTDLERVGDQAYNIKRYKEQVNTETPKLDDMGDEVKIMLQNVIDAFIRLDVSLALEVIRMDNSINEFHQSIAKRVIERSKAGEIDFEQAYHILRIVKNLERIGDMAKNIAEDVVYIQSGEDIRHLDEDKK